MEKVKYFLRHGKLLPLNNLNTQFAVQEILGVPEDVAILDNNISIYKYRNYEFSFFNDNLVLIAIYNAGEIGSEDQQILNLSINDFINYLDYEKITWRINLKYPIMEDQYEIILKNEISVICNNKTDRIESIMKRF